MLKLNTIRKKKKMGIYVILKNERSWRENKCRLLPLEARTGQNRSQVRLEQVTGEVRCKKCESSFPCYFHCLFPDLAMPRLLMLKRRLCNLVIFFLLRQVY